MLFISFISFPILGKRDLGALSADNTSVMDLQEPLPKRRRSYNSALQNGTVNSMTEFVANYKIPVETFRKWHLQDLEDKKADGRGRDRSVKDRLVGYWLEVENRLHRWFQELRERRLPVGVQDIHEKAPAIFDQWWVN
jgi:hypothetical protein